MIYVDDMMGIISKFKWGTRFKDGKLIMDPDARLKDREEKRCNIELTKTICLEMLNSISVNIQFTAETIKDFTDGWLPTLDFKMRMAKDGTVEH